MGASGRQLAVKRGRNSLAAAVRREPGVRQNTVSVRWAIGGHHPQAQPGFCHFRDKRSTSSYRLKY